MKISIAIALLATATPALASSPAAWAATEKAGARACLKASNLREARASAPILFSDSIGRSAYLVAGTWPQPFMKGAKGTMLCLYDRRTGKAEASEAKGWRW